MIFLLENEFCYCQINDNFNRGVLENGNYDILDVTDNFNLKLIVTTAKNIYTGTPPSRRTSTNANLINSTSIITINENYLLAACLQDSLLTKIKLSDGSFSSLINYDEIEIVPSLDTPTTTCSLSFIQNYIFIGYSRVEHFDNQVNKTIIIIRLELDNINNNEQGPCLEQNSEKKLFIFPYSTVKTHSSRQISCEPLNIKNDIENYRLICFYEDLKYDNTMMTFRYMVYANVINENFTGLEFEKEMDITNITGGIRLYKISNINGIFVMRKIVYKIYLEKHNNIIILKYNYLHRDLFYIELDLFDYKSNMLFSWIKNDFMNISNIYCFRINKLDSKNHYEFYDYQEEKIKRMLSYYDESNSNIFAIYQSEYKIKYFSMKFIEYIYNINEISNTIEIKTYEKKEYNFDELINGVSNIGQLNVE